MGSEMCIRDRSVPLSLEEQRPYRVRDGQGRVVRDVFGSPEGSRTVRFLRNRKCSPMLGYVQDAGTMLDGWRQKCLMNAVLQCAPVEVRPAMRTYFLEHCANNIASGACGSGVERANFEAVVAVLGMYGLRVRVWGVSAAPKEVSTHQCRRAVEMG